MIPPAAQRAMAIRAGAVITEAIGSHAVYVSQPDAVADLIRRPPNRRAADPGSRHPSQRKELMPCRVCFVGPWPC